MGCTNQGTPSFSGTPATMFNRIGIALDWIFRLLPAAVLLSLAFVLDGGLRWLGLMGVVTLCFALSKACPRCGPYNKSRGIPKTTFHTWPGH